MMLSQVRSSLLAVALVASAVFGSFACKDDVGGTATGSTCPSGSTLTYENFGKAFMQSYCLDCHSSASGKGESPFLDTVAEIRSASAEIDRTSAAGPNATNTAMPEDGSVSTDERSKLGEWLACGAP